MITFILCTARAQGIKVGSSMTHRLYVVLSLGWVSPIVNRRGITRGISGWCSQTGSFDVFALIPALLPKQNPNPKKDPVTSLNITNAVDASCVLLVGIMYSTSQGVWSSLLQPCSSWWSLKIEQEGSGCTVQASQAVLQKITLLTEQSAGFF